MPGNTRRKARIEQWDLDAEVAVREHDRERLEQLCRYLLRPPLALDRLRWLDDGHVCLELKRPWADRSTHVTMTRARDVHGPRGPPQGERHAHETFDFA